MLQRNLKVKERSDREDVGERAGYYICNAPLPEAPRVGAGPRDGQSASPATRAHGGTR